VSYQTQSEIVGNYYTR